jgi:hypothetical protein
LPTRFGEGDGGLRLGSAAADQPEVAAGEVPGQVDPGDVFGSRDILPIGVAEPDCLLEADAGFGGIPGDAEEGADDCHVDPGWLELGEDGERGFGGSRLVSGRIEDDAAVAGTAVGGGVERGLDAPEGVGGPREVEAVALPLVADGAGDEGAGDGCDLEFAAGVLVGGEGCRVADDGGPELARVDADEEGVFVDQCGIGGAGGDPAEGEVIRAGAFAGDGFEGVGAAGFERARLGDLGGGDGSTPAGRSFRGV